LIFFSEDIAPDSSFLMAAGLGIAKAINSNKKSKHFAEEVMDDETATDDEDHDANKVDADLSSIVQLLTFKTSLVMVTH
jgi:hypothetical protein